MVTATTLQPTLRSLLVRMALNRAFVGFRRFFDCAGRALRSHALEGFGLGLQSRLYRSDEAPLHFLFGVLVILLRSAHDRYSRWQ